MRLSKAERREQLLDAAASILVERGLAGVTMEGVAAEAGVSKALPYAHFDNAEGVLIAVYERESELLVRRVSGALDATLPGEIQLRLALTAFFDHVIERGAVLAVLGESSIPKDVDRGQRLGQRYLRRLLRDTVGLDGPGSLVVATIAFGALWSSIQSLARRDARRRIVEETAYRFILAGVRAAQEVQQPAPAGTGAGAAAPAK